MRDGVTQMHERGQTVNEHQPVFRAGTNRPLPVLWPVIPRSPMTAAQDTSPAPVTRPRSTIENSTSHHLPCTSSLGEGATSS